MPLRTVQRARNAAARKWTNRIMFALLLWKEGGRGGVHCAVVGKGVSSVLEMASQQHQHWLRSRGWRRKKKQKKKTIHYLVQTPVVQRVHSGVIQRQKCAVNAGKQRNWGVTYNERHHQTTAGGGGGEEGRGQRPEGGGERWMEVCGRVGGQIQQQHFLKHCSNFEEAGETYLSLNRKHTQEVVKL